jgi:hypothetical protein
MLTPDEIQEFKKLAKEIMNIDLTDAEAEDQGGRLIQSFELMIRNEKLKKIPNIKPETFKTK